MEWFLSTVLGKLLGWVMDAIRERWRNRNKPLTMAQVKRHHIVGCIFAATMSALCAMLTFIFVIGAYSGGDARGYAYAALTGLATVLLARSARRRWRRYRE